jgi:hypothetical protein
MASEKQRVKQLKARQELKDAGLLKKNKYVHLICTKCHCKHDIRVNNMVAYTNDVVATYKCFKCK